MPGLKKPDMTAVHEACSEEKLWRSPPMGATATMRGIDGHDSWHVTLLTVQLPNVIGVAPGKPDTETTPVAFWWSTHGVISAW
jgi:hypothetical protein